MIFYSKYRLRLILESPFRPQGEGNARLTLLLTYSLSRIGVPIRGQNGWDQRGNGPHGQPLAESVLATDERCRNCQNCHQGDAQQCQVTLGSLLPPGVSGRQSKFDPGAG